MEKFRGFYFFLHHIEHHFFAQMYCTTPGHGPWVLIGMIAWTLIVRPVVRMFIGPDVICPARGPDNAVRSGPGNHAHGPRIRGKRVEGKLFDSYSSNMLAK